MPGNHAPTLLILGAALALSAPCGAQSFYELEVEIPTNELGDPDPDAPIRQASLFFIDVPKPKKFEVHELVTIIIDETSSSESKQSLDTKKDYDLSADVTAFPDLLQLLELRLAEGDRSNIASLGLDSAQKFKGEGTAKRSDRFVARLGAEVIDIKPNGNLVIEARKVVQSQDGESKTIVLSGVCRQEDITDANTINSSQLADLKLSQTTTGEVSKTSEKGLIPRVLEAIFNF